MHMGACECDRLVDWKMVNAYEQGCATRCEENPLDWYESSL